MNHTITIKLIDETKPDIDFIWVIWILSIFIAFTMNLHDAIIAEREL